MMELCACGSGLAYAECCRPVIKGERRAETAEALMRARYAAYANVETDFLLESTHPKHREGYDAQGTREWAEKSEWQGLEIVSTKDGGKDDATGEVEFIARWKEQGEDRVHHERALFKKEKEGWLFTDGKPVTRQPVVRTSPKIGRNDPCSCGSGVKYKKCCGK
ncbi:YchJ family protein [Geomonas nitrogeniifigens]|uniref:YchJ family protein n=1 Tax=Geomonas diazotrophica TaxID=2843197 RepID=A0ABX8JQ11_9BACT|nr:YchJ family protein [Geomonas nitrogeniifigens]QWV99677.1 YchJ family protein [Geomonas nitrogeniifigens]QXE88815.1 YchJ family protein [Geomonas nitrogeniifigens]